MSWNRFWRSKEDEDAKWKMQKMEYQGVADTLHKLSSKCFQRCAQNVNKPELSTAEMLCLDRCTRKYVHVVNEMSVRTAEISKKYANNI